MDRRELLVAAGATVSLAWGGMADAQVGLVEGRDFKRVSREVPVVAVHAGKKLEVIDFFWYGCPHCYAFEPSVRAWSARVAHDVHFRRVPVGFGGVHEVHQRLYFAVAAQPNFEDLHRQIFFAIHGEKKRLDTVDGIQEWARDKGIGAERLVAAMTSAAVESAAKQARLVSIAYGVDSVPSLGVNGKYLTSPGMAGSYDRAFGVVDALLKQERG